MKGFALPLLGVSTATHSTGGQHRQARAKLAPKRLLRGAGASVGISIALGKLTSGPLKAQTHAFDGWLLDATRAMQNPVPDRVMSVMSALGEPVALYPLSGLVAAVWLVQQRQQDSAAVVLAIVGSAVIDKAIKSVVKRPRPFLKLPLPRSRPSGSSFPSNHATMSVATYGTIALLASAKRRKRAGKPGERAAEQTERQPAGAPEPHNEVVKAVNVSPGKHAVRRKQPAWRRVLGRALVVLFCALVGWSRVYRGVHNPSDVLGGWLAGGIWLAASTAWARAARNG